MIMAKALVQLTITMTLRVIHYFAHFLNEETEE